MVLKCAHVSRAQNGVAEGMQPQLALKAYIPLQVQLCMFDASANCVWGWVDLFRPTLI